MTTAIAFSRQMALVHGRAPLRIEGISFSEPSSSQLESQGNLVLALKNRLHVSSQRIFKRPMSSNQDMAHNILFFFFSSRKDPVKRVLIQVQLILRAQMYNLYR